MVKSIRVLDLDISEIVHLYVNEKLSTHEISEKTGIPSSSIRWRLKELGILRNHKEATKIQKWKQLKFTCRSCGKRKLVNELVIDRRYSPPIPCCKECAGWGYLA